MQTKKLTDILSDVFCQAAFKKCPDLDKHEILEAWVEGDNSDIVVIQSKRSNEYGTQIVFTRLRVSVR